MTDLREVGVDLAVGAGGGQRVVDRTRHLDAADRELRLGEAPPTAGVGFDAVDEAAAADAGTGVVRVFRPRVVVGARVRWCVPLLLLPQAAATTASVAIECDCGRQYATCDSVPRFPPIPAGTGVPACQTDVATASEV